MRNLSSANSADDSSIEGGSVKAGLGGFVKAGLVQCPHCLSNLVTLRQGNFEGDWKLYVCSDCGGGFFIWQAIKPVSRRKINVRKRLHQA